ncbi:MAG: hypothetical protein U9M97_01830 [Candidatus Hadarchaeota archaeon]|nr:hypothetical protein [Candidatus Hadarchaeota archaeon]
MDSRGLKNMIGWEFILLAIVFVILVILIERPSRRVLMFLLVLALLLSSFLGYAILYIT